MLLSSTFSFIFVPTIFAEFPLNSSSTILNSNDVEELFKKANYLYEQQKYDEAIQYYNKVWAIDPSYVDAYFNKALILKDQKRYDEALQYYDSDRTIRCWCTH